MKVSWIANLLLICLVVFLAQTAGATQVRMVNFSNGLGRISSPNHQINLILGEPLLGRNNPAPGQSTAVFGFWEMWAQAGNVSHVGEEIPQSPNQLLLNIPNPFNPSTLIRFTLAEKSEVKIDLYDLRGRKVETLFDGVASKGATSFMFQPRNLASGAYVILMRAGTFRSTQCIMLLK